MENELPIDPEKVLALCVAYGEQMLGSQIQDVESAGFDFVPQFISRAKEAFLFGAFWKAGEVFELQTTAQHRASVCLLSHLVSHGMSEKEATKKIASIAESSIGKEREPIGFAMVGYQAIAGDGSFRNALETFRTNMEISGAKFRMIRAVKPLSALLAFASFSLALILDRSIGESLAIAALLACTILAVPLTLYRQPTKEK